MTAAVVLFPGQGSQHPGMCKDVHDAFATARAVFDEAEESLRLSLRKICFELSADELRETRNAQLALLVHGAAMWAVLREHDAAAAVAAAGHSVGEYAAFHAAGALGLPAVVRLVETRGRAMAGTGDAHPGAMAAFIGPVPVSVEELCSRASRDGSVVVPANFNAPEQVVVSGDVDAVERVMELATLAGVRKVVRLNVSGAFHSPLMRAAQSDLLAALEETHFDDPAFPVYTNVAAAPCNAGSEARELLGRQLVSPVRWLELIRKVETDFPETLCLELGPGKVLDGLVKRCAPSLRTMPCGTARDLDTIAKVLA